MQDNCIIEQFVSEAFVNDYVLLHTMFVNDALEIKAVPMQDSFITKKFVSEA